MNWDRHKLSRRSQKLFNAFWRLEYPAVWLARNSKLCQGSTDHFYPWKKNLAVFGIKNSELSISFLRALLPLSPVLYRVYYPVLYYIAILRTGNRACEKILTQTRRSIVSPFFFFFNNSRDRTFVDYFDEGTGEHFWRSWTLQHGQQQSGKLDSDAAI